MCKEATEIEIIGRDIDYVVNELLEYKENGISVYVNFNGHKLYSENVTLENAYLEITGKTKEEFDSVLKYTVEKFRKESEEHESKIPELSKIWIDKGKKVLSEDKWEYWSKIVPVRLGDFYRGMELGNTLDIISSLNENDFNMAKEKFDKQGHSGMSASLVFAMVDEFCGKGKEFKKFME